MVHCSKTEHKRVEREVAKAPGSNKTVTAIVEDPSVMCFVNKNGAHFTPRSCQCYRWRPSKEDRKIAFYKDHEKFHVIESSLLKSAGGGFLTDVIPPEEFKRLMVAIYGKVNPNCPIEDEHAPIDPDTARGR